MKRIIALWLAALMLAAQPVQAAVCVGFGQATEEPGLLLHWDGTGTTAGTVLVSQETTTVTNDGATFSASGAAFDDTGDAVDLTATDGSNYNKSAGSIKFTFTQGSTASPDATTLISLYGTGSINFSRYTTTNDRFKINACGTSFTSGVMLDIFDQSPHTIIFSWNDATDTIKIDIDSGAATATSTGLTMDCTATNATLLTVGNLRATGTVSPYGVIKDVKIYSTSL